jgi:hypothetical protein
MKKQIVAILAIIAVISSLLTVSALSNEVGYKLSPCDAIDISIENTAVTDFLNATNMTTVQVYNFKGYIPGRFNGLLQTACLMCMLVWQQVISLG